MSDFLIKRDNFSKQDLADIVEIHRGEIGDGFLSSLGNKALELVFRNAVGSKNGVLLAATHEGKIVGFICGTLSTSAFYKDFMIKHSFEAVIYLLPKLLSFSKIKKVFETLFYPEKKEIAVFPKPELLDFAISKTKRGSGLAQNLFEEFALALKDLGCSEFKITTGESLLPAQKFYEKMGAKKAGALEIHKGDITFIYTYTIS